MQLIWPRIAFAVVALVVMGSVVDGTITFECDATRNRCDDALHLRFNNTDCSGTATAIDYDLARANNGCSWSYGSPSKRSTCGNGQYQVTSWPYSRYCKGDPYSRSTFPTHVCSSNPSNGTSSMVICGPNDVDAPVTPPSNKLPNPDDPQAENNERCPNGVCRPGFASHTVYETRTCEGNSSISEVSYGVLGICYQNLPYNTSYKVVCHESFLRFTTYAGSCNDRVIATGDIFRKPGSCSILDQYGFSSATEIFCPIVSPDPLPPSLPGHASSMSHSGVTAFIVLLVATLFVL